jgi:hypothetical protein
MTKLITKLLLVATIAIAAHSSLASHAQASSVSSSCTIAINKTNSTIAAEVTLQSNTKIDNYRPLRFTVNQYETDMPATVVVDRTLSTSGCDQNLCVRSMPLPVATLLRSPGTNYRVALTGYFTNAAGTTYLDTMQCSALFDTSGITLPGSTTSPAGDASLFEAPTNEDFDRLNPLIQFGSPELAQELSTPGGIVSRLLLFAFPAAGLVLFVMLIWGGFEVLLGALDKKRVDAGKQRITAAVVGFLLLFVSYWLVQIIEYIFGLVIL